MAPKGRGSEMRACGEGLPFAAICRRMRAADDGALSFPSAASLRRR